MTDEHCDAVFKLEDGETARLHVNDTETTAVVTKTGTKHVHSDKGPNITEQRRLRFERRADGSELNIVRIDGLSGTPGPSPFPTETPLFERPGPDADAEIPDDKILGYVTHVTPITEP